MSESTPHILVVDDEEDIQELLVYNLKKEGFETSTANDGQEALELATRNVPDLMILDVMMPRMDGLETCTMFRKDARLRSVPILMLTAKSEQDDHLAGLDAGADFYLAKPIAIPILIGQVKAILRSLNRRDDLPDILTVHDLEIDRSRYHVRKTVADGVKIHMPRKEFELLRFLAGRPGRVFSRQDLLDRVWGTDVLVVDRTVDVHVRKIREKIGESYIETVKGVGYRFKE